MDVEKKLLEILKQNKYAVLATVYKKSGSVPRGPGAKLALTEDGKVFGTIGGGSVENNTINFAKDFFNENNQAKFLNFNLAPGKNGENIDMICGGRITILLEKFEPNETNIKLFEKYLKYEKERKKAIWIVDVTNVKNDMKSRRFIISSEKSNENLPKELFEKIYYNGKFLNKNQIINIEDKIYFVDPFIKKGNLILLGAGHISAETAKLAYNVGFNVIVIDDREEFANKNRFPEAEEIIIIKNFENVYEIIKKYNNAYFVILTRAHLYDQTVLEQVLNTDSSYIGMIGSKKKRDTIYENLLKKGIEGKQLNNIHSPIGLNIGAQTPEEIAVSIVAELIQTRANGLVWWNVF